MGWEGLWGRVILAICGVESHGWLTKRAKRAAKGRPWVDIDRNRDSFMSFLKFKVDPRHHIQFWEDPWVSEVPLSIAFPSFISYILKKHVIANYRRDVFQTWNLGIRRRLFDKKIPRWPKSLLFFSKLPSLGFEHEHRHARGLWHECKFDPNHFCDAQNN